MLVTLHGWENSQYSVVKRINSTRIYEVWIQVLLFTSSDLGKGVQPLCVSVYTSKKKWRLIIVPLSSGLFEDYMKTPM